MKKLLGILLTLTLALSCLSLSASAEEAAAVRQHHLPFR